MKFQRKPNRLKDYDYSQEGCYFITVCSKNHEEYFGSIINENMILNRYGDIVNHFWKQIPEHYSNIELDEYIVMPNHIHGIIFIYESINSNFVGTEHCSVPTVNLLSKYGLLSKIVKSFKEIVVKTVRREYKDYDFGWQRSFYDHIVSTHNSLNKIREYISDNPLKWDIQKNKIENLKI